MFLKKRIDYFVDDRKEFDNSAVRSAGMSVSAYIQIAVFVIIFTIF